MNATYSPDGESWVRWLHDIRRIEFDLTNLLIPLDRRATVLELGSGDGFQLGLLRQRYDRVFAIDPERRPERTSGFSFAMAEALPFPDGAFDLVVSSCVVEHLMGRPHATEEMLRVLRPGGYMAHVVPSPIWKAASLLLNPIGYPWRIIEKWQAARKIRHENKSSRLIDSVHDPEPGILQVFGRWFYPPVHGTYTSHYAEFRSYARDRWIEMFTHPQLVHVAEEPLFSYTQFGLLRFRLLSLRLRMAQHGLASSRAYILRKVE